MIDLAVLLVLVLDRRRQVGGRLLDLDLLRADLGGRGRPLGQLVLLQDRGRRQPGIDLLLEDLPDLGAEVLDLFEGGVGLALRGLDA